MSALSAETPSTMSQPVRKASAPRLAPPRRKSRRVGSGMSLAASFTSSRGSTPGIVLRRRGMLLPCDHGAQRAWHQQRHHDVNDNKSDDRRHGKEVHIARRIIAAEK